MPDLPGRLRNGRKSNFTTEDTEHTERKRERFKNSKNDFRNFSFFFSVSSVISVVKSFRFRFVVISGQGGPAVSTTIRESLAFGACLAVVVGIFLHESLFFGKILSPADVLQVQASFGATIDEPANRLLMDPVLQFEPWLELARSEIRAGRLPLWNDRAGCGAPLVGNGQSAVFDPFHLIAYLGPLPESHARMAAARLWTAGLGAFLLAGAWGLGPWGRWFAGLVFPLSGFLVVWLLFPVTGAAIWLPWLLLATDRLARGLTGRRVAAVALVVALMLLAGHVQTAAHGLLAGLLFAAWTPGRSRGIRIAAWLGACAIGVGLAAIPVAPLAAYLARSPVWTDREAESKSPWTIGRPRVLDLACTALPYAYGSQRRGQPNLAKPLGVHNLNESAGGFAGLATIAWLAPLAAVRLRRGRWVVAPLTIMLVVGLLGAFDWPPVANLLRALPVLRVTDNRRLTQWVAFGLTMLGAIGIDGLGATVGAPGRRAWIAALLVAAGALVAAALVLRASEPRLRSIAIDRIERSASDPGVDREAERARAVRHAHHAATFLPAYYGLAALQLAALAALAMAHGRGRIGDNGARRVLFAIAMADLFGFGLGLNPAIAPADARPTSPLIDRLAEGSAPPARVLGVGAELPPNAAMRYGLADLRNYDSIENAALLAWLGPLFDDEPGRPSRTSRRPISWAGVARARGRLEAAGVAAVVGVEPPPPSFERVERVGRVFVAWLDPVADDRWGATERRPGYYRFVQAPGRSRRLELAEMFDPGWRAVADGRELAVGPGVGPFLAVDLPAGARTVELRYDPAEVRVGRAVGGLAALAIVGLIVPRKAVGKRANPPWSPSDHRVRIDPNDPRGPHGPGQPKTEGSIADDPLLV